MVVGSMDVNTDLLIIGGGPAGYVAALRAAKLGKEVTLVEKDQLGGVCLNYGCIPTKALIHSSNYFSLIKELEIMGITFEKYDVDINKMREWKSNIISRLRDSIKSLLKNQGVEVIEGKAVFKSNNEVHIEGKSDVTGIKFEDCIIATGSSPIQIKGFEFDKEGIISSREALELKEVPNNLIIIGGGYIGTEMGTVFGKLGSKVQIVEFQDRLISVMEKEIVDVVTAKLSNFNIELHLNAKAKSFSYDNNICNVTIDTKEGEKVISGDKVLVVIGRKPNISGFGLETTGVELDDKGFIKVDNQMRSSVKNIYAIGDVVGQPMLAHKGIREAKVAAEVINGLNSAFDNQVIPSVVFNDPEICSVGLTEKEAKDQGFEVNIGKFPFSASGRAQTLNKPEGFIKLISDKKTSIILGMQGVGENVSNLISEVTLAIEMGATVEDLALTIHPHPTLSESIMDAAENILGKNLK